MSTPFISSYDERKEALDEYDILDTLPEKAFDDLTKLASAICKTPISLISLLDQKRQWFKSSHGLAVRETPIELSFCSHAVQQDNKVFVVENALEDDRFRNNTLVTGQPHIRSYAGAVLFSDRDVPIGTICAVDSVPRQFTAQQKEALQVLADQVMSQLELRRKVLELEVKKKQLSKLNSQLDHFAYIISHDLKAPIRHQNSFSALMREDFEADLPADALVYLDYIERAGEKATSIITDLSDYLHTVQTAFGERQKVNIEDLLGEIIMIAGPPPHIKVTFSSEVDEIQSNTTALRHILLNLVSNAIKYNNKQKGEINLEVKCLKSSCQIKVSDNGPGIPASDQEKIFDIFGRGRNALQTPGKGLGLAIASKLATNLGGSISVESSEGQGATFTLELDK